MTVTERQDRAPVEIGLGPKVRFHFHTDGTCTAFCGTCGNSSKLTLTKPIASQLRNLFEP